MKLKNFFNFLKKGGARGARENQADFVERFGPAPSERYKYLFIMNSPHAGARLFYNILYSSVDVATFMNSGDTTVGQGLFVRNFHDLYPRRPVMPEVLDNLTTVGYQMDWRRIRQVFHAHWQDAKVFCDRGGLYLHHGKAVENYFSNYGDVYFIIQIRNPYNCESLDVREWVKGAQRLKWYATHLHNKLVLRYEDLVKKPEGIKKQLVKFLPELETVDVYTSQSVRLNTCNRYKSYSQLTTRFLDIKGKEAKNEVLKDHVELLEFFGYKFLG